MGTLLGTVGSVSAANNTWIVQNTCLPEEATCKTTISDAITAASTGDTILVNGTFGSIDTYTVYSIYQPITIRGVNTGSDKAKVFGTFLLYVDGVTIDNLSITNKGINHPDKNAINLLGKQVTITNNDFNLGNGTGGVANGVVIWPYGNNAVSLNITGNTFMGYSLTVTGWSSTALFIVEEFNASPFTGTPLSTTLVVPNEESFANGNTYINNSYDYVHQNWNGGSKWFYSKVSNSAGLSDAIADSAESATILVGAGTYTGQITIDKPLSLIGADKNTTIIDGGGNGVVITVTASNVSIKGFTITNDGNTLDGSAGIGLVGGGTSTIEDNIVTNNITAVAIMGSDNNIIKNNTISNNSRYGIVLDSNPYFPTDFSNSNTIDNNILTNNARDGIYIGQDCDTNIITDNSISGASGTTETPGGFEANGIYFWKSAGNTVTNNTVTSNTAGYGIEMYGSKNNTITSNEIKGNLDGFHIRNINEETYPGYSISGNNISNNKVYDNTRVNLYASPNFDFDIKNNWWGTGDKTTIVSGFASWTSDGLVTPGTTVFLDYTPWYVDEGMTTLNQTIPNESGNVTLTNESEVIVSSGTQPLIINIGDTIGVSINYGSLITSGAGNIPQTTIQTDTIDVYIPATTITSSDTNWDGVVAAPTTTTVDLPTSNGYTKTLDTAIEVGFASAILSFDNAVKLVFPGAVDKKIGYSVAGGTFTEINTLCTANTQSAGNSLAAGSECKIDSGSDLVVWTKHFTKFATYTQTTNSSNGGGGGGRSILTKDVCPNGDFSPSLYDTTCGIARVVEITSSGEVENNLLYGDNKYSQEFNNAYQFAFGKGITTMSTIEEADMEGNLIRAHMAKMMVNYAMNVLKKTANTGTVCEFTDLDNQSTEMKEYAIKACQLGLMGVGIDTFMPNGIVTRAEFGTVLSRMLYDTPNSGSPYFLVHLNLLKDKAVITNDNPNLKELRAYVMLMLMRAAK